LAPIAAYPRPNVGIARTTRNDKVRVAFLNLIFERSSGCGRGSKGPLHQAYIACSQQDNTNRQHEHCDAFSQEYDNFFSQFDQLTAYYAAGRGRR
jgi:hypothetical protein